MRTNLHSDAAGYAYIYQPEASPIARRARYKQVTLSASKSCTWNQRARPAGKGAMNATRHALFNPPHSNFRTTPHVKFSPPTNQYFILRTRPT